MTHASRLLLPLALMAPCATAAAALPQRAPSGAPATLEAPPTRAATHINFESTSVHPIRVSADGARLYAVNTADGRLSVFSLADPSQPELRREVRVGLEPVSVTERTDREVWVADLLSDSVTVLDPVSGDVLDVLQVEDEPSDVAFAGGRAFVSCATVDRVLVFDAVDRTPLGAIEIPAKDPRALAVSSDGSKVLVLSRRSGNGTTVIPEDDAPPPPPPVAAGLPPAPQTALIVRADDPAFAAQIPYTLPDRDVIEIDAQSLAITRTWSAAGTTLYDVVATPGGGAIVAGTDAKNLTRFEPELRGDVVEHRLAILDGSPAGAVVPADLNVAIDPAVLPNPGGLQTSLAEPTGLALEDDGSAVWVAAHASDRVARVDATTGAVLARVDVGSALTDPLRTLRMRGPRGLALHPTEPYLYVHNRLSATIGVVRTDLAVAAGEVALAPHDPVPSSVRLGARFLYDARLSGNGLVSCAVCHVDGDTDGLAWDLGDPGGEMITIPEAWQQGMFPGSNPPNFPELHPMKGPLVTQPLRGLEQRLHWRGDKDGFGDFNGVFDSLMGGAPLDPRSLALFVRWADSVTYPPNPNLALDRSLSTTPFFTSQQRGFDRFTAPNANGGPSCIDCHALPSGTNGFVRDRPRGSNQPMRIGPLRDFYRKTGFDGDTTGENKAGFGRFHSGEIGDLSELGLGGGGNGSLAITAFLMAFDTGTAPAVGHRVFVDPARAGTGAVASGRALLEARATLGEIDLIAHGTVAGVPVVMRFDETAGAYAPAARGAASIDGASLLQEVVNGGGWLVLMGVPPGSGVRWGRDRDLDGTWDMDE